MIAALTARLGSSQVLTAPEDILPYAFDGTAALKQRPLAVVFPANAEDVAAVLRIAREHRVPVVTRGNGTGLSGGSVPVEGSLVLCVNRLDQIRELDTKNLTLRTDAGVVTQRIFDAADVAGLFYPPDPGSMKVSTIG